MVYEISFEPLSSNGSIDLSVFPIFTVAVTGGFVHVYTFLPDRILLPCQVVVSSLSSAINWEIQRDVPRRGHTLDGTIDLLAMRDIVEANADI